MSTTMKAVRLEAVGTIALREVARPIAGPDELLVRIEACGVCGTDRHLFHGEFPCTPPVTLGHEFSGIVEAVGGGVYVGSLQSPQELAKPAGGTCFVGQPQNSKKKNEGGHQPTRHQSRSKFDA